MLALHEPAMDELSFRQAMLADGPTMAYNHAYGGTIPFPEARWADWHAKWVSHADGRRFYRYLRDGAAFVGEVAYRHDEGRGLWLCDVLVLARLRGRGYGTQGLALLCAAARARGLPALYDDIAADNPSLALFLRNGFAVVSRNAEAVTVRKAL